MRVLFSREMLRRHWSGALWLLPALVLGMVYDARHFAERVPVPSAPDGRLFEYHLTPFTTFLGQSLPWVFWGGIAAFLLQAAWQRKAGAGWFWAKIAFLPLWFVLQFFLFFHVE